ncbi:MAG: serine hydroxymethyltransferase, partial [Gammaproteobacteria bacterium]|nr:serine hydroxymethyltransferase [Gammaproteobacteria bacterium]
LIAVGLYPSPVQIADVTTSTTHKTLRGPRSGLILAKANPEIEKKLNSAVFPGMQGGPLEHVIAAKAVAFKEALEPEFKIYQQQVMNNAKAMAETILERGYDLVSGRTENHLLLLDLTAKNITGQAAEHALGQANITVNKNTVPNDPRSPFVTSGLRIGTPAITTRGFKEADTKTITNWICDILDDIDNQQTIANIRQQVIEFCGNSPVYKKL